MIKSFKNRQTEAVFHRRLLWRVEEAVQRRARDRLRMINRASSLNDLAAIPVNRLRKLGGNRKGQYSIRIDIKWRECFVWEDGDAREVELTDYR